MSQTRLPKEIVICDDCSTDGTDAIIENKLKNNVIKRLDEAGIENIGTYRRSLDITNEEQVKKVIRNYKPDVVIN